MHKDIAVNKILRDLQSSNIIMKEDVGMVRIHLGYLWTAGWDEGRKKTIHYTNKEVHQCDKEGHVLAVYKSATEAAKQLNCTRETIYLAIAEKRLTRKGHYWKHKKDIISE